MAETVVGALKYQFTADTSKLKAGLADAQNNVIKLSDHVRASAREFERQGAAAEKAVKLTSNQMLNLSRQINDVGVSLAGGMSPLMVLTQQGGQIADVFAQSGVKVSTAMMQMAKGVGSALFNIKTLSVGVAGAIAAIGAVALNAERSLERLSDTAKALGSNRGAVKELNRQASILGMDPDKMNEELTGLAQKLREAQIAGDDLSKKLAKIGIDIKSFDLSKPGEFARLFQQLAEKIKNSGSELDRLNALKLLGLSSEFERLFTQGGEALSKFVVDSRTAAENSTKPLEEKYRAVRALISEVFKNITDWSVEITHAVMQAALKAIDAIITLIDEAKRKWAEFKAFVSGGDAKNAGWKAALNSQMARAEGGVFPPDYFIEPQKNPHFKAKPVPKLDLLFSPTGNTGGAAKTDQLKNYIDGLKEAAQLAQQEADNWKSGNVARENATALLKAENIAKKEGKTLSDQQRADIERYAEQSTLAKQKVDDLKRAQDNLNSSMREFADMAVSALDNLVIKGQKAGDVLRSLVQTLASSALKGLLTGEGTFGKIAGLGGKDGALGGILGSIAGAFLPKFAAGGTLGAGKWGIAGEAGPELIQGPANVVPFGKMGGGARISVHNYAGADVQTRQMSDGEILVLINQAQKATERKVPGIVANSQRRSM